MLAGSICFHEYSPGLVSSILMRMNFYFVVRFVPRMKRSVPTSGFRH